MGNVVRIHSAGISPGQPNDAVQVGQELDNIIETGVNDNDSRITANEAQITTNTASIAVNTGDISDNAEAIDSILAGGVEYIEVVSNSYSVTAGSPGVVYVSYSGGDTDVTLPDPSAFVSGATHQIINGASGNIYLTNLLVSDEAYPGQSDIGLRPGESVFATVISNLSVKKWYLYRSFTNGVNSVSELVNTSATLKQHQTPDATPLISVTMTTGTAVTHFVGLPPLSAVRTGTYYYVSVNISSPGSGGSRTFNVIENNDDGSALVYEFEGSGIYAGNKTWGVRIYKTASDTWKPVLDFIDS